mmetsp:Transcript_2314/g.9093  ORF Transcript_2314/g.9093 Transcript_2314/m.9093 type:complete len:246 (-) Transcript_2314:1284-2021(-)
MFPSSAPFPTTPRPPRTISGSPSMPGICNADASCLKNLPSNLQSSPLKNAMIISASFIASCPKSSAALAIVRTAFSLHPRAASYCAPGPVAIATAAPATSTPPSASTAAGPNRCAHVSAVDAIVASYARLRPPLTVPAASFAVATMTSATLPPPADASAQSDDATVHAVNTIPRRVWRGRARADARIARAKVSRIGLATRRATRRDDRARGLRTRVPSPETDAAREPTTSRDGRRRARRSDALER